MTTVRTSISLVAFVGVLVAVAWSFVLQHDRLQRRAGYTRQFLTIETPGLAEQLAVQQQRVRAATGRFASDPAVLVASFAARFADERQPRAVAELADRHRLRAAVSPTGFAITVHVRDDGGAAYRVTVDTARRRVARACDEDYGRCRDGTWRPAIEDRFLLGRP